MKLEIIGRDEGRNIVLVDGVRQLLSDQGLATLRGEAPAPDFTIAGAQPGTFDAASASEQADANGFVLLAKAEHEALLRTAPTQEDLVKFAKDSGKLVIPQTDYDAYVTKCQSDLAAANDAKTKAEADLAIANQRLEAAQSDLATANAAKTTAETELEDLRAHYVGAQQTITNLQSDLDVAKAALDELKASPAVEPTVPAADATIADQTPADPANDSKPAGKSK